MCINSQIKAYQQDPDCYSTKHGLKFAKWKNVNLHRFNGGVTLNYKK